MENENIFNNLLYERVDDVSILSDFCCGIYDMDEFIHGNMQNVIKRNGLDTYIVKVGDEISAVFSICEHKLKTRLSTGVSKDYDTIEIEYLAVSKDKQRCGIGKSIINYIIENLMQGRNMLSVSAYIDIDTKYTAAPFYEKCGFMSDGCPIHELADHVRMIKFI